VAQLAQNKRGYLRGVRGLVVTRVNADGTADGAAVAYGIRTAQQVALEIQSVDGEESVLRGGDKVLARVKDPATVVGLNLTVQDARFDAQAIVTLCGGTLIEVVEGADTRINGWEAPSMEAQQTPPHFKVEVYAVSHGARAGVEGYVKYTFYFCRTVSSLCLSSTSRLARTPAWRPAPIRKNSSPRCRLNCSNRHGGRGYPQTIDA
jgi:hypothetical protein